MGKSSDFHLGCRAEHWEVKVNKLVLFLQKPRVTISNLCCTTCSTTTVEEFTLHCCNGCFSVFFDFYEGFVNIILDPGDKLLCCVAHRHNVVKVSQYTVIEVLLGKFLSLVA